MTFKQMNDILDILADEKEFNTQWNEEQDYHSHSEAPTYYFENMEFNEFTLNCKITFVREQEYRTIIRYEQRNYVRYPIFSPYKTKTKFITKKLKLTNRALENLPNHEEKLIRVFRYKIVRELNNEELYPSWAKIDCLNYKIAEFEDASKFKIERLDEQLQKQVDRFNGFISLNEKEITKLNKKKAFFEKKARKLNAKITKIKNSSRNLVKALFTLFLYNAFISQSRLQRLLKKQNKILHIISCLENDISLLASQNNEYLSKIENEKKNTRKSIEKINNEINCFKKKYEEFILEVVKLPYDQDFYTQETDFIHLKNMARFDYQKINGVYIIKNNELNKYYVGQSKDVLKRLKQHFKGTVPANSIFAEDYYMTKQEKTTLFSVKIIPLTTKDELDRTEKELINKYDARENGYNGTNGNN